MHGAERVNYFLLILLTWTFRHITILPLFGGFVYITPRTFSVTAWISTIIFITTIYTLKAYINMFETDIDPIYASVIVNGS